jgi:peptide/nickel transport system permease protein
MIIPILLWTDALVFLLVGTIVVAALYARKKKHLREPWRQVMRSRMGVAAMVVLSVYVVIGLLDSMHYRQALLNQANGGEVYFSAEVVSVLDLVMEPIKDNVEKTYSAPFAAYAYAKETTQLADGQQVRLYPRLKYGGAHLENAEVDRIADIVAHSAIAVMQGVLIWLIVAVSLIAWLARRQQIAFKAVLLCMLRGQSDIPWRVMLLTIFVVVALFCWCVQLGSLYHILGTDKVGQDVLYQALKSVRTGLVIGTLTTLVMLPFAVMLGIMAGYLRGWVDDVVQYLYTTLNSIPGVLLIAAAVLMLQVYIANHPDLFDTDAARADIRLLFLCVILGITSWTGLCRMLRGESMKLREMDYIEAAVAFGVGRFKVVTRHILPNVMHIVMISVVLDFSGLVLAEAVLSYVGVGVDPTMHSWGNMINSARLEMAREPMVWWSLLAAFIFMFVLVLAANLFSDAVRDAFDPRLRK